MALPWSHPGPPVGPARGEDHVPGPVTSGGNGSSVDPGTSGGVEEVSPSGSTGSPCSPCSSESPDPSESSGDGDSGAVGGSGSPVSSFSVESSGASPAVDRKSTRLNSSHANISYAVFCLKKKKRG